MSVESSQTGEMEDTGCRCVPSGRISPCPTKNGSPDWNPGVGKPAHHLFSTRSPAVKAGRLSGSGDSITLISMTRKKERKCISQRGSLPCSVSSTSLLSWAGRGLKASRPRVSVGSGIIGRVVQGQVGSGEKCSKIPLISDSTVAGVARFSARGCAHARNAKKAPRAAARVANGDPHATAPGVGSRLS